MLILESKNIFNKTFYVRTLRPTKRRRFTRSSSFGLRPIFASAVATAKRRLCWERYMKYTFPFRAAGAGLSLFYNEQI